MIDRHRLVTRHNPTLHTPDPASPLTVGNGGFAFTADVTGFQSLHALYGAATPLCTMAHWGWHSFPNTHSSDEVALTEYDFNGRTVNYAVEKKPGNEAIYDWLRQNPHRLNLGRIALQLDEQPIAPEQLVEIDQHLNLWEGILYSAFTVAGGAVTVWTACAPNEDTLAFAVNAPSELLARLSILLDFPYGSPEITASDWVNEDRHHSTLADVRTIHRQLDATHYRVLCSSPLAQIGAHQFRVAQLNFSVRFSALEEAPLSLEEVFAQSAAQWRRFWSKGGAIDLSGSSNPRAQELERRIVLSQYLMAVQCASPLPPQETGLTCNSWYGKFHLEMLPSHSAWMPLWGQGELLQRVLPWYHDILPQARANAAKNGYRGARWPKMTGPEGVDSPSAIATLLVWQQPHIIWLLELLYRAAPTTNFLREHWVLVQESAEFMADYAVFNVARNVWELLPPLIPVQEEFAPRDVKNPTFEVVYWHETLQIALAWAERLGESSPKRWQQVADNMAVGSTGDGVYLAHDNCPETFTRFRRDHPSMLFAHGMCKGERMDPVAVRATLERVLFEWNLASLWGWDFGQMAMTATRLGLPDLAVDILLMDTVKNSYVTSGNNFQRSRSDLPLYLPGNGTLLLAAAMMCAGYDGCTTERPGFPTDGSWVVQFENLNQLP